MQAPFHGMGRHKVHEHANGLQVKTRGRAAEAGGGGGGMDLSVAHSALARFRLIDGAGRHVCPLLVGRVAR